MTRVVYLIVCSLCGFFVFVAGCSSKPVGGTIYTKKEAYIKKEPYAAPSYRKLQQQKARNFGGWNFITDRLRADGVHELLLKQVYSEGVVPAFDFVPFKLVPRETHGMYQSYRTTRVTQTARGCYRRYRNYFDAAAKKYGVVEELLVAILVVETHCGTSTGKDLTVNRLSRVAAVGDPGNLAWNFTELNRADRTVTFAAVENRAKYLLDTFYPQLLALFQEHQKGHLNIFTLRGSSAGAFGWPQFLPRTYQYYGIDGDNDGKVSLFAPADAIFSVANFFKGHGWKNNLNYEEKQKVIWHYNRSIPYIDTVLYLSNPAIL